MPQAVKDKPSYAKSDKSVFEAYKIVIRAVKSVPPDEYLQQVSDMDDEIRAAKAKLDEDMQYMQDQMKDAKNGDDDFDKEAWLELSGWKDMLEADRNAKKTLEAKKMELTKEWDKDHKEALDAVTINPDNPGFVKMMTNRSKPLSSP